MMLVELLSPAQQEELASAFRQFDVAEIGAPSGLLMIKNWIVDSTTYPSLLNHLDISSLIWGD